MLAAVDRFMGRKVRSSTLNRIDEEYRTAPDAAAPAIGSTTPTTMERGYQARIALDSMRQVSQFLGGVSGRRKALVLFSEGIDYDINDVINNRDATTIMDSTRDLLAAATRANVADLRRGSARTGRHGAREASKCSRSPTTPTLGIGSTSFQNELRLSQDSLRVMSERDRRVRHRQHQRLRHARSSASSTTTARTTCSATTRPTSGVTAASARSRSRCRAIPRHASARARATSPRAAGPRRPSRRAERPDARTAERDGQPAAAVRAADGGDGRRVQGAAAERLGRRVGADWRRRRCRWSRRTATFRNRLELAFVAVNQSGKSFSGGRNTLDLNMKPDTAKRAAALGLPRDLDHRSAARPLRRCGSARARRTPRRPGRSPTTSRSRTSRKEPLLMSSLALTSAASSAAPTARSEGPAAAAAAGPAVDPSRVSRRPTRWRSSPRSTTTPPTGRTR